MVEGLLVVTRVVLCPHLGGVRELRRLDEVLAPHIGRFHVELAGQHVHCALDEVCRFRPTCTSIGIGRGLVGEDLSDSRADGGEPVRRVRHQRRECRNRGREQHVVGADIDNQT